MPADRKALPRNDGDREAVRILLVARREMTTAKTQQINRLRALLLTGDDADRGLCRGAMTDAHLQLIARRRGRPGDTKEQQVRRGEAADWRWRSGKRPAPWPPTRRNSPSWSPRSRQDCWTSSVSDPSARPRPSPRSPTRGDAGTAVFAALSGVSPLQASSGRTVPHRLLTVVDLAVDGVVSVADDRGVERPRPVASGGPWSAE